jgi:hypothetical protein
MVTLSQTSAVEDMCSLRMCLSSYSIRLPQDSANFRTGGLSEGGGRVWAIFTMSVQAGAVWRFPHRN